MPLILGSSGCCFNHILFNHLLKNAPLKGKYHSLLSWLKLNGYKNYFLNGLGEYTNKIDWDNYNRLYDIDEFIEYYGIGYKGQLLDFVGHIKKFENLVRLSLFLWKVALAPMHGQGIGVDLG